MAVCRKRQQYLTVMRMIQIYKNGNAEMGIRLKANMQNILTKMNQRKKACLSPKHPFFLQKKEFKQMYGAGVFMHAGLNDGVNTLNNFELERLLSIGLGLDHADMAVVIRYVREERQSGEKSTHDTQIHGGSRDSVSRRVVEFLLRELREPASRYIFLLDLFNVSMEDEGLNDKQLESIEAYAALLLVRRERLELLRAFITSARQSDVEKCRQLYQEMERLDMGLSLQDIRYYIPDLSYMVVIGQRKMEMQKQLTVVDNCEIHENLVLYEGMSLTLDHATLRIYGSITLMGGELNILGSHIIRKNKQELSGIYVKRDASLMIYQSEFECRHQGMAVKQEAGELRVVGSRFSQTTKGAAIRFWGRKLVVENCTFSDCYTPEDGGALYITGGEGSISGCSFNDCEARRGGAVCCHGDVEITNCRFTRCRVEEYASAVYGTEMLQDKIKGLTVEECMPFAPAIVQYIGAKGPLVINEEFTLGLSSIFDGEVIIEENGTLTGENLVLIINTPVVCRGKLRLKKVSIEAGYVQNGDLFVLPYAKECVLEQVELDGACRAGGIRATGTRVRASKCVFRNTSGGRAIYDAYMPSLNACVFNFCQDGAVLCQGGTIEKCMFINCRSVSGAGIIMQGRNGNIEGCTFRRCVAEYHGGAVLKKGGHQITNCGYEECKPEAVF